MMPRHALAKVHCYLRREYRKPADMRACDYFQQLVLTNTQQLPLLPPFGLPSRKPKVQSFSDPDVLDILLFATPKKWQHEMDQMGSDPLACVPESLLCFMKNCEATEDCDTANMTVTRKPNNAKNGNKGAKPSDPKKQKWCDNHGWSNHTTAECNQNKPGFKKGNTKPKAKTFGNKMNDKNWQCKADDPEKKEVAKKELNAYMKKPIRQHVRKELTAFSKKKSGDDDLNMLDVPLHDFNYENMDNTKIDSDLDISNSEILDKIST